MHWDNVQNVPWSDDLVVGHGGLNIGVGELKIGVGELRHHVGVDGGELTIVR